MMKIHQKLTLIAASVCSIAVAHAEPLEYWAKTPGTKVVWKAPQQYEYDTRENPKQLYWCGHAALKIALASFGVHQTMSQMDKNFATYDGTYRSESSICTTGSCASFQHMQKEIDNLAKKPENRGLKRGDTWSSSETAYFNDMKNAIDSGKIAISLSSKYYSNGVWKNIGHFFVIHGYRIEPDGRKFLYLRDPLVSDPRTHTDWHEIPLSELWKNMKNSSNQIHSVLVYK